MIKVKMSNGDQFLVDGTRRSFTEYELHYTVNNFGQSTKIQRQGLHTINTVNGKVTINVNQICSIEDINED
ncbi:hypothetical protein ACSXCW_02700 [Clostridium perfringens]